MSETPTSKTGHWVDLSTGEVVTSAPERGLQLVPPGAEITPARAAAIKAAEEAHAAAGQPERATKAAARETTAKRRRG